MTAMTYKEQYLHPSWQKRRLERLDASGWICQKCEAGDVTLHVHHRRYVKGRKVWEYDDSELTVLCEECHADEHAQRALLDRLLMEARILGFQDEQDPVQAAVGIIAGYYAGHFAGDLDPELAAAARATAPMSYCRGLLLGGCAGVVRVWDMASLVRESHAALGQAMPDEVRHLMDQWESLRPAGEKAPQ